MSTLMLLKDSLSLSLPLAQLQDKAALEERKSSAVADMKETIDYQKTELDKLRSKWRERERKNN